MEETFRIAPHEQIPGQTMVEVWRRGVFIAGIYPHEDGLRVVSKYMSGVIEEGSHPQAAVIKLDVRRREVNE